MPAGSRAGRRRAGEVDDSLRREYVLPAVENNSSSSMGNGKGNVVANSHAAEVRRARAFAAQLHSSHPFFSAPVGAPRLVAAAAAFTSSLTTAAAAISSNSNNSARASAKSSNDRAMSVVAAASPSAADVSERRDGKTFKLVKEFADGSLLFSFVEEKQEQGEDELQQEVEQGQAQSQQVKKDMSG